MGQILHVFRKDVRHHWPEVVLSTAILAFFAWTEPSQWAPQRSREFILPTLLHDWLPPMVAIGWLFLIVRVVHGEQLVGDRQFWVTRPYEWKKLLIAKALFIAAFINVPLFVFQAALLWKGGFTPARYLTGLVWMQLLWFVFLILPMTTLSTVTSGLGQTVLVLLGILLSIMGLSALSSVTPDIGMQIARRIPEWFQPTILLVAFVTVILWQYARRRTLQARLLLAGTAAVVVLTSAIAPHPTFNADAYRAPSAQQQQLAQLSFDPTKPTATSGTQIEKNKVYFQIPLLVSGIARDSVVINDGMLVEIEGPGGLPWNSGWFRSSLFLLPGQTHTEISFGVDKMFFEQVKSSTVKLSASFALTAFQAKETHRIVLTANEFRAPGNAWCSIYPEYPTLYCRSAVKAPFVLATTLAEETTCPLQENEKNAPPGAIFSALNWNLTNAPAEFGISPVRTFALYFSYGARPRDEFRVRLCPGTTLIFGLPEETERARGDLLIHGLRLSDYQVKNSWSGVRATGIGIAVH
jgi:hypothetical protein